MTREDALMYLARKIQKREEKLLYIAEYFQRVDGENYRFGSIQKSEEVSIPRFSGFERQTFLG